MNCNKKSCGCNFNVKLTGMNDVSKLNMDGSKRETLNWTEISIPEILCVPELKPDIENIDQVYANVLINNSELIETPFAYKSYDLYVSTAIITQITAIVTAATTAITPALITALNTAVTAIITAIEAVPVVAGQLTVQIEALQALLNDLTPTLTALTTALANLTAALAVGTAEAICAAIDLVLTAANALLTLVNSISSAVTALVAAATALDPALGATLAGLTGAVTTAVTAIVTPVNTLITNLSAVVIDCEFTKAFEIIPNAEGTCLTGRKLIIEGELNQKIVYTADVDIQSVHSAHYEVPFIAFIIPYASFEGLVYEEGIVVSAPGVTPVVTINGFRYNPEVGINPNLCEEFNIYAEIEDIYVTALDPRTIFKNVTLFLKAKIAAECNA